MAVRHEVVENRVAVQYHGVTIYHTHKDNDFFNPTNDFVFSTDPFGNEDDVGEGDVFDIRTLKTYRKEANVYQNLLDAIDEELFGETNLAAREGGEDEYLDAELGNANEHRCPVCKAYLHENDESVWGDSGLAADGTRYVYSGRCPRCNASFKQVFRLVFDGYNIE